MEASICPTLETLDSTERRPNDLMSDASRLVTDDLLRLLTPMACPELALHGAPSPTVARDVDEHAHEPGLLRRHAARHRARPPRHAQEDLLHQVARLVSRCRQPPRQSVEPRMMRIEERHHASAATFGVRRVCYRQLDDVTIHSAVDAREGESVGGKT